MSLYTVMSARKSFVCQAKTGTLNFTLNESTSVMPDILNS